MFVVIKSYHSDIIRSLVDEHKFSITVLEPSAFNYDYGFFGHKMWHSMWWRKHAHGLPVVLLWENKLECLDNLFTCQLWLTIPYRSAQPACQVWLCSISGQNANDKTPTPKPKYNKVLSPKPQPPNTKVNGITYIGVLSVALWPDTALLSQTDKTH